MRVLAVSPDSGPSGPFPLLLAYTAALQARGAHVSLLRYPVSPPQLSRAAREADVVIAAGAGILQTREHCDEAGRPLVPVITRPGDAERFGVWRGSAERAIFAADWLRPGNVVPGVEAVTVLPPCPREAAQVRPGSATKVTAIDLRDEAGGALFWVLAARHPEREFLAVSSGDPLETRPDLLPSNVEMLPADTDLLTVWPRTRLLLLPGREVLPAYAAHAAAWNGIPAIATHGPAAPHLLGPGSAYVEPGDVAGWDRALARLDDPEEYADVALAAMEWAEDVEAERPDEALWGLLADAVREAGPLVHLGPAAARGILRGAWLRLPSEYRARRGETARDRDLLFELPGFREPETAARVIRVPPDATTADLDRLRGERETALLDVEFIAAMALGTDRYEPGARTRLEREQALGLVRLGKARRVILSATGD